MALELEEIVTSCKQAWDAIPICKIVGYEVMIYIAKFFILLYHVDPNSPVAEAQREYDAAVIRAASGERINVNYYKDECKKRSSMVDTIAICFFLPTPIDALYAMYVACKSPLFHQNKPDDEQY